MKIFAREPVPSNLEAAIPLFHRWIQEKACPEMLIDVSDYRHVPNGPGVILVAHEAIFALDGAKGRLGMLYTRRAAGGEAQENLRQAYDAAAAACRRIEESAEFGGSLRFDPNEAEVSINDRLLAPNTDETWSALKPELEKFLTGMWGAGGYTLERRGGPRELFCVGARRK